MAVVNYWGSASRSGSTVEDFANLADTTVLLLTGVFLLVNICVPVLRRDPVGHRHFVAPPFLPVIGAIVSAAVTRRTGTVIAEADLTREEDGP